MKAFGTRECKNDGLLLSGSPTGRKTREHNLAEEILAQMGAARKPVPDDNFLEMLHKPSTKIQEVPTNTSTYGGTKAVPNTHEIAAEHSSEEGLAVIPAWNQLLLTYLINRSLP